VFALLRARSPILGPFALSVFSDTARFRVKRVRGDIGANGSTRISGRTCFKELRRLESAEMLIGDRGVSKLRWPTWTNVGIMKY
jgi:hypothetical protein